ncbi:MAG: hypothetical protein OXI87_24620 [Albidovulum sp.]|nr:hypothetical protein [Albidovulum sp.]MDE0533825.1 hypothetical protein [Albidovulum sp.]
MTWPEAADMDDAALVAALYPTRQFQSANEGADWANVETKLSGRGMTLKLQWKQWREMHPDGMSHVTWYRRSRAWSARRDATMRRRSHSTSSQRSQAQGAAVRCLDGGMRPVFAEGGPRPERLGTEQFDVRCFEDLDRAPQVAVLDDVPENISQCMSPGCAGGTAFG